MMCADFAFFAPTRLFARKGEAQPAADDGFPVPIPVLVAEAPMPGARPAKKRPGSVGRGGLSSLIQRRPRMSVAADDDDDGEFEGARPRAVGAAGSTASLARTPFVALVDEADADATTDPRPVWRKLTFRLRQERYGELKRMVERMGTTYQSVLETAVIGYLVERTKADKASQGTPARTGA